MGGKPQDHIRGSRPQPRGQEWSLQSGPEMLASGCGLFHRETLASAVGEEGILRHVKPRRTQKEVVLLSQALIRQRHRLQTEICFGQKLLLALLSLSPCDYLFSDGSSNLKQSLETGQRLWMSQMNSLKAGRLHFDRRQKLFKFYQGSRPNALLDLWVIKRKSSYEMFHYICLFTDRGFLMNLKYLIA